MTNPIVYVMCGIPGSGKSYWSKEYIVKSMRRSVVYISSDDIRAEICGDARDQSKNDEVFRIFYKRARRAAQEGKDVVLDATHLTRKSRRKCLNHFKNLSCKFIAVQLTTSVENAMYRNKTRERVVPNYAMERMINMFEPVGNDEGFDDVWRVK